MANPQQDLFVSDVRARSDENQRAFELLYQQRLMGPALALVRQELDSMMRVIWLLDSCTPDERRGLIDDALQGKRWRKALQNGKMQPITDVTMAKAALPRHGWIEQVYKYGCHLIHLSDWHGYRRRDPLENIPPSEVQAMKAAIENHHGDVYDDFSFMHVTLHAPSAIEKIGSNLRHYLDQLARLP